MSVFAIQLTFQRHLYLPEVRVTLHIPTSNFSNALVSVSTTSSLLSSNYSHRDGQDIILNDRIVQL